MNLNSGTAFFLDVWISEVPFLVASRVNFLAAVVIFFVLKEWGGRHEP